MTTFTATYSPDDNKLRLYASQRLDNETFQRVRALGFRWAPRQELFVKPTWSPGAEDLLIELCGEIGDEDSTLTERAEQRAERFEDYSGKRLAEAESARKTVDIRHISHACTLLRPGGRIVAICADGPRQRAKLEPIATEYRPLPAGTFKAADTMVNTALVVIDAPPG